MNIKDFKPGQQVYVAKTKRMSKGGQSEIQWIEEWSITSVGKKYIKAGKKRDNGKILKEVVFEFNDALNRFVEKNDVSPTLFFYTRSELGEEIKKRTINKAIELIELSGDYQVVHIMNQNRENGFPKILAVSNSEIHLFYIRYKDLDKGFEIWKADVALLTDPMTHFDTYEWSESTDI